MRREALSKTRRNEACLCSFVRLSAVEHLPERSAELAGVKPSGAQNGASRQMGLMRVLLLCLAFVALQQTGLGEI